MNEPDVTRRRLALAPERNMPVAEMSGAELSRYRRALVRYLKHCPADARGHAEQQAYLAEVMAEEQTRRLIDNAGIALMVPRVHLLKSSGPCGSGYRAGRA